MLGARLRTARVGAGLTQSGLAKAAGISSGMVGALEREERELTLPTARRLAEALEVSEQWLLGLDPAREPPLPDPGLLAEYQAPPSLLELKRDFALRRALSITRKELDELFAMRLQDPPDKAGWVALVQTLRAVRLNRRRDTVTKP
jgi:transcriptional regulator with XRE-family HTH domain